jgi:hypothetical protein
MPLSPKLKSARDIVIHLEGERQSYEDEDAKIVSEYLLPHRGYWPEDGEDKATILERGKKNINPASTLALERAAGGLTTGMTPEGQPWKGLKVSDDKLMEAAGVREHLEYRNKMIDTALRMGGFYQAIHLCNIELLGFPGMLLFADTSVATAVRFECCTFGTYAIALDEEGNLDTVVRRLRWSAKQLERKFGKKRISKEVQELLKEKPYEKVDIIHLVRPRDSVEFGKIDNRNMKYASLMYEARYNGEDAIRSGDTMDVLSESGYHEMPYFFAPFARVGASDYGMSPGHLLIGHTKQLNETERQKLIALQKMISPPMKKPGNFKGSLNVGPGAENAVSTNDPKGLGPLYEVPVQGYQYALQEIQDVMTRIAAVAKADLFVTMPDDMRPNDMTATEWLGRKREKLQQIAPVISIYEPQVLDKVIERVHNVLDRAGLFPPAPPALTEAGTIEIEYVSTIAKALRQVGAESTRALALDVKGLAEIQMLGGDRPTVLHKFNFAQAIDEIASGVGAPASVVRDDEAFAKLVEADEKAAAEQAAKAEQQAALESAAKLGNVSSQGTVLGDAIKQE